MWFLIARFTVQRTTRFLVELKLIKTSKEFTVENCLVPWPVSLGQFTSVTYPRVPNEIPKQAGTLSTKWSVLKMRDLHLQVFDVSVVVVIAQANAHYHPPPPPTKKTTTKTKMAKLPFRF